jgi:predicted nucleic-acid-binding protein
MIGVDTNVLVRAIVDDDPAQGEAARQWMKTHVREGIVVDGVVLCELVWVLRARYRLGRRDIIEVLASLLDTVGITILDDGAVRAALRRYQSGGGDFADYLIAERCRGAGAERVATFDQTLTARDGFTRIR